MSSPTKSIVHLFKDQPPQGAVVTFFDGHPPIQLPYAQPGLVKTPLEPETSVEDHKENQGEPENKTPAQGGE
jgi:hypothetical protein